MLTSGKAQDLCRRAAARDGRHTSGMQTPTSMRQRWWPWLLALATLGASAQGTDSHGRLLHDGLMREYRVHLPPAIDSGRRLPLLLAFHGGGGDMALQADDALYGLRRKADEAGFIVVFPNGVGLLRSGKLATWNAGRCCGAARDRQVDDVGFVRALVERLQQQLPIDPARIFATGMSNGGMLAHRLACEMADTFRAVAAVAGTDNTEACAPTRPVSVLQLHARDDTHVLFDGGAGPDAFRDRSKVTDFVSVPETMRRWRQRNGCQGAAQRVLERPGAWCERHEACAGGARVQLCVTEAGGHSWPGASQVRRGKAPASQALSANDVMWDFFNGR